MRSLLAAAALLLTAAVAWPAHAQNADLPPSFGTFAVKMGFQPDPMSIRVTAGGRKDASRIPAADCAGQVSEAPDVRIDYDTDGSLPLVFVALSRDDITLVVNGPDGTWYCNDDVTEGETDAAIAFPRPESGRYDVWIGTYDGRRAVPAVLMVTESP
jgi:hypothetical protein